MAYIFIEHGRWCAGFMDRYGKRRVQPLRAHTKAEATHLAREMEHRESRIRSAMEFTEESAQRRGVNLSEYADAYWKEG